MKKLLFKIITVFLPVVFFVFLEIILRIFFPVNYPKLFIEDPNNTKYLVQNRNVASRYFTNIDEIPYAAHDPFLKEKTSNVFRVFVVGESTAAGFPYSHGVAFPRQLQYLLQTAYPDKIIEVINTSMSAISSHVFVDFMDEIIDQSPDLIIVHGGHNEFYGALTVGSSEHVFNSVYLTKLYLAIRNFSTVELIRNFLSSVKNRNKEISSNDNRTLMEEMVKDEEIGIDSKSYLSGLNTFKINFQTLLKTAKRKGIFIISSTVVWNEKDVLPLEYSSKLLYPLSVVDVSESLAVDTLDSESFNYFLKGLLHFENSEFKKAKESFLQAKEFDKIRFRAPNAIQNYINVISNQQNVPLVDLYGLFEKNSSNGILGSSLLTEHVHPNNTGYELMAFGFFEKIIDLKIVDDRSIDVDLIERNFQSKKTYSNLELRMGEIILSQLVHRWPFVSSQYKDSIFTLERFRVESKVDQLAKNVLNNKIEWPDAVYQYVDIIEKVNPNEAMSSLIGLSQEYPYVSEIALRSNELGFRLNSDTTDYQEKSIKLLSSLTNTTDKLILMNQLLTHNLFETLIIYVNHKSFNVPNKNFYQKAISDIIEIESEYNLNSSNYLNAAGAAIFLKNGKMAQAYLNKAEKLGADQKKLSELKALMK